MKLHKSANLFASLVVISMLVLTAGSVSNSAVAMSDHPVVAGPLTINCAPPEPPRYWCLSNVTPSSNTDVLSGVSVLDYNNIWAVGTADATFTGGTPLAQRWLGMGWLSLSVAITSGTSSSLNAVAAIGTSSNPSVWAVGSAYQTGQGCWPQCILVEHASNSGFTRINNLNNKGTYGNGLAGVMAIDDDHVWAVGGYNNSDLINNKVLIEHCTLSGCTPVDDTNLNHGTGFNILHGIAGVPDTAYAVGYWSQTNSNVDCRVVGAHCYPLILKGTGSNGNYTWSRVADSLIDYTGGNASLNAVDWFNDNDVWAVGSIYDNSVGAFLPLILHYDGSRWHKAQNIPTPSISSTTLNSVFVTRERDVWAVGSYSGVCGELGRGESSNCGTPTPSPTPSATPSPEWGVWGAEATATPAAISTAGTITQTDSLGSIRPLAAVPPDGSHTYILHWHGKYLQDIDGQYWDVIESPNPGGSGNQLLGVAAPPASQPTTSVWAVGSYSNDSTHSLPLVENFVAPDAPANTHSYFMGLLDEHLEKEAGFNAGYNNETGVIVLDFGSTKDFGGGVYGTALPRQHTRTATTEQIAEAVENFAYGYHEGYCELQQPFDCAEPPNPIITIAVGTDNYSIDGYQSSLTPVHAQAWARMVKAIQKYVFDYEYDEIRVAAAFDAEPGWSLFAPAATWAVNYISYSASTYYDFGSADAYPCDGNSDPQLPSGMGCADWSAGQMYTIAFQGGQARPLPEMYGPDKDALQAGYWYAVKRWSGGEMQFAGVMTHYNSSSTFTYTPAQGWQVLWLSINGDPLTRQQNYLSTDLCDLVDLCNTVLR